MIAHLRNRGLIRIGFALALFGLVVVQLMLKKLGLPEVIVVLGGLLLGIGGIIVYLQGCLTLAAAKGHSGPGTVAAIVFSAFLLPGAIAVLPFVLLFGLKDRHKRHHRSVHRGNSDYKRHSHLDRIMRCRRNAIVGNYFGVAGIAAGIFLVLFRFGIFADHSNEIALGIFVFMGGYAAVLWGCGWWLKAKGLNEALVFIGMMPLAVLFVPYVRLIYVAAPMILPLGMIVMPIILIVIVFILPDRSGLSKRRHSPNRDDRRAAWLENVGSGIRATPAEQRRVDTSSRQDAPKRGRMGDPDPDQPPPKVGI